MVILVPIDMSASILAQADQHAGVIAAGFCQPPHGAAGSGRAGVSGRRPAAAGQLGLAVAPDRPVL